MLFEPFELCKSNLHGLLWKILTLDLKFCMQELCQNFAIVSKHKENSDQSSGLEFYFR